MIGDGPVSDQTVQIAGFNVLECANLEEALLMIRAGEAIHGVARQ